MTYNIYEELQWFSLLWHGYSYVKLIVPIKEQLYTIVYLIMIYIYSCITYFNKSLSSFLVYAKKWLYK